MDSQLRLIAVSYCVCLVGLLLEDKLVAQKPTEKTLQLTPSIKSAIKIIQLKRPKSHWLCNSPVQWPLETPNSIYRQSIHDSINPTLKASNRFPLLTFSKYQGKQQRRVDNKCKNQIADCAADRKN